MPLASLIRVRLGMLPAQVRQDLTAALVGFSSWAAVAWKLTRLEGLMASGGRGALEVLVALAAALVCLWPVLLGSRLSPAAYGRWREWLVPAHLAMQHWIGLQFAMPKDPQQGLVAPGWATGLLPVFLATFSQPWLYLAFGVCLQRTRLRTFLCTQLILLAPILLYGREHCAAQLASTPEVARHLQVVVTALQRCSAWLPISPLRHAHSNATAASDGSGGGGDGSVQFLASSSGACLAVHFWLVLVLAYCLPAIIIHRLEGLESRSADRKQQPLGPGGAGSSSRRGGAPPPPPPRTLLLQRRETLLDSLVELLLAGYASWLVVQLVLPLVAS